MTPALNTPHGGRLVDLLASPERRDELRREARDLPSWTLGEQQLCDLELLSVGAFSPLDRFMGREEHERCCRDMRLRGGELWPIPITLDVDEPTARSLEPGSRLGLRDEEGVLLAVVHVEERWQPDRLAEARAVFGTESTEHPGVARLLEAEGRWAVGGRVEAVELPRHHDFTHLRRSPAELRAELAEAGWTKVVAFQTRNPMHRAHHEITLRAAEAAGAKLLVHPVVGMTKPGDVDHYTRVRCYEASMRRYPEDSARLALLPLAMRMAGPREALWHAIIRKNYGCSHLIVGRDHAGPGSDSKGVPFYGPEDAQALLREHERELGIEMVPFRMMVYVEGEDRYQPVDELPEGASTLSLSGTELRERLRDGREIPDWFTWPEVAEELRASHPPLHRRGFTVFFTGLSGAGKSTIAQVLLAMLLEREGRPVTLLDGDIVRRNLSSELGFSKEHRDLNIRRIGFVASEITKHGGIALCAPIAPYESVRREVRDLIAPHGGYFLVHVSTPLEVCEQRDRKGLYAKARAGIVKNFTGISDPYEEPVRPDLRIDTSDLSPEEAGRRVVACLEEAGYLRPRD